MVGLLVPIALALTGCSSSTPAGSSSPTTATTNVAVPPPSAPVAQTAGPAPAPVATYAYTAKSGDGTVEGGTIAFYKPRSATSFLPWEGWPSSNCQPDVARDAYLPVAVTIENRTPNFPATTRVGLEVQPGAPYPVTRDEGSTCQSTQGTSSDGVGNEGEAFNAGQTQAPAGSGSATAIGYIVLPGFYSPAFPNGAFKALGKIEALLVNTSIAGGGSYALTSVTGKGAHYNMPLQIWLVTMDGSPAGD